MAYQEIFNSSQFNPMGSFNPLTFGESEEERRRREQEEARQREAMLVSGPVAPPAAPGLTESEVTPGYQYQAPKPQPFRQTLTTDPVTGRQTMKMEGAPQDFTAANPFTPTIAGPMAPAGMTGPTPQEIMRDEEQRRQYEQMMAQPAAPVAPAQSPMMLARAPGTATDVTAGVQAMPQPPAGQAINPETGEFYTPVPAQAAPAAAPAAAPVSGAVSPEQLLQRQMMSQDIQEGPVVRQAVAEGAGPMAMNWFNVIQAAQSDPGAMERIARDPNTPEQWRRVAADQSRMTLQQKRDQERAEIEARKIIQGGGTRLTRAFQDDSEAGSRLKLALYEFFLGSNSQLAKLEASKLTGGWEQVSDSQGNRALVYFQGGRPIKGIGEDEQPIPNSELLKYAGGGAPKFKADIGDTVEATIDGKELKGRVMTVYDARGRGRTVVQSGNQEFPLDTRWKNVRISEAAEKETARKEISLQFDPKIRSMVTAAEQAVKDNAKYGTNVGVVGMDAQNRPIYVDNNTGRILQQDAQGRVTATIGGAVPGGTARRDVQLDVLRTGGQEAVKGVENFSQQTSDRAATASETAGVARRIRTTVDQNPQVVGLLTKKNDKGSDILTAAVAAIDAGLGGSDAIEQAAKQLNLNTSEQAIYEQVKGDLVELALARARENKGQGTFTDFERRLFASTTGDLARNQASAIKYRMEIFEYAAEKQQRKTEFVEDYRLRNPNATAAQINNAFRQFNKEFDDAFEKRMMDTYIRPKQPRVLRG